MISITSFLVIVWEVFDDILAVSYGFNEKQLGFFWAVTYLISAALTQLTPRIAKKLPKLQSVIVFSLIYAASYIISPVLSMIFGGMAVILRSSLQPMIETVSSKLINSQTDSRYRATTLSAFQMFAKLPYVFTAYFIGTVMDWYSPTVFASIFGMLLFLVVVIQLIFVRPRHR